MKLSRGQRDEANSFLAPPLPWCCDLSLETCAKWSTDCPTTSQLKSVSWLRRRLSDC
ncbi:hypothetical protein HMPREF9564_02192 [Cutibacterium acnes HL053PA1]|nr:hypothetical protein HMPREF9576_01829 [Cutibacterium acnes HL110PA2]EFS68196.1 hypothetical protein HMPREF9616_02183 [Cutibacterium acnes HL007PA1]EFT00031.1 hypothetical protein HMPREF9609_01359 [Cutibacterium acnes HL027PA1]EFT17578.1 hypothetical protein HMPREF9564_02192 [Cutibacterium acnes HL053PA1]EGF00658.1 hypothetical protein HMPREF9586_01967 [Cutibacterium acnes HL083PA2]EGF67693.1 hypothetical protein HMPREF9579_01739 [Cutibacterium acnes HL087PA1]EGR89670.1 hypothetical protein